MSITFKCAEIVEKGWKIIDGTLWIPYGYFRVFYIPDFRFPTDAYATLIDINCLTSHPVMEIKIPKELSEPLGIYANPGRQLLDQNREEGLDGWAGVGQHDRPRRPIEIADHRIS